MSKREKNNLGQYFTPTPIAELMVGMMTSPKDGAILEPSSGTGVFLDALTKAGFQNPEGVEIDTALAHHPTAPVHNQSFITWEPTKPYNSVIGNPPYIRWRDLDDRSKEELQQHELWGTLFTYLTDYLTVFIAKSVQHLAPGGELLFITPRFWMHTQGSAGLRNWLLKHGTITDIVDFDEATVFPGVSSSIIIFRYVKSNTPTPVTLRNYIGPRQVPPTVTLNNPDLFTTRQIPAFQPDSHWTLGTAEEQHALTTFEAACSINGTPTQLHPYIDVANGLVSGMDAAFRIPEDQVGNMNQAEQAAIIQVLKAKNTERLRSNTLIPYIYITDTTLTEETFQQNYPLFATLLEPHKEQLLKRHSYTEGLQYWQWAFPRSASFHLNGKQKLMVPVKERLTSREHVRFTLAPEDAVATQDMVALVPAAEAKESIEYLTAFLTLPAVTQWVTLKGVVKNNVAEFGVQPLSVLPFRPINWDKQEEVTAHDQITQLVKDRNPATAETFQQIQDIFSETFNISR